MSNISSVMFQCPEGYLKESVEPQLFCEDIDEDSELWLVRMPQNLDCSVIENQKIILDENQHHIKQNDCLYEYVSNVQEIPRLSVILPQRSDRNLRCVNKVVKGSIFISEDIVTNASPAIKMEVDEDATHFYSSDNSRLNGNTSVLLETSFSDMSSSQLQDSSLNLSSKRKKSKSKKKSHSLVDNIKTEKTSDIDEFPYCNSQK